MSAEIVRFPGSSAPPASADCNVMVEPDAVIRKAARCAATLSPSANKLLVWFMDKLLHEAEFGPPAG